jgi:ABC-type nitrate/sulfonate/bicarbonate transport system substrate-binding protein
MRKRLAALCVVSLLTVVGCGDDDDSNGEGGGGGGTTNLTVGVIPVTDAAPVYVAIEKGLFKAEGLNVKARPSAGGAAGIPTLVSGDVQIDVGNMISVLQARQEGIEVTAIPGLDVIPPDTTMLMSAADSPIKSPDDLQGRKVRVAVNTAGNLGELMIRAAWERAGLDWNDVKLVQIEFPEMIPALDRGDVDLAWLPEPFKTQAEADGGHVILDTTFTEPPMEEGMPSGFPVVTDEFLEQNQEPVEKFVRAVQRAGQMLEDDPKLAEEIIPTFTQLPVEVVRQIKLPQYAPEPNPEAMETIAGLAEKYGLISEAPPVDDFFHVPGSGG